MGDVEYDLLYTVLILDGGLMIERAYSDLKELLHTRKYKEMSSALAVSYSFHYDSRNTADD